MRGPSTPIARNRAFCALLLLLLVLGFVLRCADSIRVKSATWDETHYYGMGVHLLETFEWSVQGSILHPPLSFYIQALPLLAVESGDLLFRPLPEQALRPEILGQADVQRGQRALAAEQNRGNRLLDLSRLANIVLAALVGLLAFAWARALYGTYSAGIVAALLYFFCPNLLAHARLLTPDLTLTVTSFAAMFLLWLACKRGSPGWWVLAGAGLGLALLSKYTAVMLPPVSLFLLLLWRWLRGPVNWLAALAMFAAALLVLWAGYGFDLSPYLSGLEFQWSHAGEGHRGYLMGEHSREGWWSYFWIAVLIKTPLPALLLFLLAFLSLCAGGRRDRGAWLDSAFLLVPALAVLLAFSIKPQAIGLRYVLPIYPLLYVFSARLVALGAPRWRTLVAAILLVGQFIASAMIHPHYLAYFNEIAGGPGGGHDYLVDSNLDWGQDLPGLKEFMDEQGLDRIQLSYFGTDSPRRYGITYDWLPSVVLDNPRPDHRPELPKTGWVAISVTNLEGAYFKHPELFAYLKEHQPVARIGHSIFVYNLKP